MYPIVEPRQRPERFLLNRFSPLAESAVFLGLGGFDAAGSVWYPDARRLLGAVPNDGTLIPGTGVLSWGGSPDLGRSGVASTGDTAYVRTSLPALSTGTLSFWLSPITGSHVYGGIACGPSDMFFFGGSATARSWQSAGKTIYAQLTGFPGLTPHHTALTVDGTTARTYINGSLFDERASAYALGAVDRLLNRTASFNRPTLGGIYDVTAHSRVLSPAEISAVADPSNVMLEVGGVPLILPPRRVSFPAAVAEPVLTYRNYILGGGVI